MENKEEPGNSKLINRVNLIVTILFAIGIIAAFILSSNESHSDQTTEVRTQSIEVPAQSDSSIGQPNKQLNLP